MAKQLGSRATVEYSYDNITYVSVGRVKKADFTPENTNVESTDNDDNGYVSGLYGNQSLKISFTVNWDPNDPGQQNIVTAAMNKQKMYLRYRARGTGTGLPTAYGVALILKAYAPSENAKVQELPVEAQSDGQWNIGLQ